MLKFMLVFMGVCVGVLAWSAYFINTIITYKIAAIAYMAYILVVCLVAATGLLARE